MATRTPAGISSTGMVSGAWHEILGLTEPSYVAITEENIKGGLPALERARQMCVNGTARMLANGHVLDPDGKRCDKPAVIARPHPLLRPIEYYRLITDVLIMHGNFVGVKVGSDDPNDMQLVPSPIGAVSVDDSTGLPWYTIGEAGTRPRSWREVLHVRNNAPIGSYWGLGVVERHRLVTSEQLHHRSLGETQTRAGGVPSVIVQLDVDNPTTEQVDETKATMMDKFGGTREPMVHGRAMSVTPVSWSPHDAEFVESRRLSFAECCWLIGLRPEDIGASAGQSLTYGNRTDDSLQRITDGYGPWAEIIAEAMSDLLPDGWTFVPNPEAMLVNSPQDRLELRQLAQAIGVETPEESRAEEGRGPLPATTEPNTDQGDQEDNDDASD